MPDPVTIKRPYRRSVLSWLHLVRIYQRVVHAEQALLAQYGLTSSQFDVLSHIATAPGLNQQALAGRLLVTKGNVAGLLDRLECAGLVKRQPDPDDRRSHRLYLTPAGRAAFEAAAPALEAMLAQQLEALDERDRSQLMALLARWDRTLRERD
ncbi:MAG: MarR family transcriptional regulator [Chloroflexota bacterium]|nr:MarR family transcriptional regulator [Aggregatilineaceae bacterium]